MSYRKFAGLGLALWPFFLSAADIPYYTYKVMKTYPHDRTAYTQGLVYRDGMFYESTGLWNFSSLRKTEPASGNVVKIHRLEPGYFAEGLTLWNDILIQLTWQAGKAFVYDAVTFEQLKEIAYPGEGWGLTHDGKHLIFSDGGAYLRFLEPGDFKEIRRIEVRADGKPVEFLNELEYVNGEIFANIWHSDCIARIAPESGAVTGWIDLRGLTGLKPVYLGSDTAENVLNGIAFDAKQNRLFVTGKLWPQIFEIELAPAEKQRTCP